MPATQLCPAVQTRPHAPQFALSLAVVTQRPPHSNCPGGHTHAAPTQLCPVAHARAHAPQCIALVLRLTSQPSTTAALQSAKPGAQVPIPQTPVVHPELALGRDAQSRPHAPQLRGSLCTLVSQPLAALPSQFANPALQAPNPHAPLTHDAVALAGRGQALLHEPQCVVLVSVLTSQPSAGFMLQSASGRAQVPTPHTPALQAGAPPMGMGQRFPQRPQ